MNNQIKLHNLIHADITTPALIFDENVLVENAQIIRDAGKRAGCRVLYALKPLTIHKILSILSEYLDGFAISSEFEMRLAQEVLAEDQAIHLTTPGIKADTIETFAEHSSHIHFNSFEQWKRFRDVVVDRVECGIRVNPQISFIGDKRYDPCRRYSKLGVPVRELVQLFKKDKNTIDRIDGILVHTNCDSTDFSQLLKTVKELDKKIPFVLERIHWINLGGGYLFNNPNHIDDFYDAVDFLRSSYDLEVFIEPGASFVREAGVLVSSVIDMFERDGETIAVLDTTVNHMTEVFEYQFEPDVYGHTDRGAHSYVLAGCSCLSGDVFGRYSFDRPLKTGSKVLFTDMGAYTIVKANTFNGINLPDIYFRTAEGEMQLIKKFTFEEYSQKNGVEKNVCF
jgi:carboxynorspermidine decarboxylase